jgi:acyl-CoA thioesterase I
LNLSQEVEATNVKKSPRPFSVANSLVAAVFAVTGTVGSLSAETFAPAIVDTFICAAPADLAKLPNPLGRTAKRLAGGDPLKIITVGSSSTAGAGASSPAMSYPSRLAVELDQMLPGHSVTVLNRGVNGEEAVDMLARFESEVLAEKPDLVIWQVGTNTILRDHQLAPINLLIRSGLNRLKSAGADVILIDPQFAPKVLAKVDVDDMVDLIATAAKEQNVDLFQRFAVMRHWRQIVNIPYDTFLSPDGLHMNDWGYGCVAKLLAAAITEAATRATLTASISNGTR